MINHYSDEDRHVVPEVLISCDENVALPILKTESTCGTLIQAIEIFDCCNN